MKICHGTYLIEELFFSLRLNEKSQNDPVVILKVNRMEVTEGYSTQDFEQISTQESLKLLPYDADLHFSSIDYVVFAIMLAMSGENKTQFVIRWKKIQAFNL